MIGKILEISQYKANPLEERLSPPENGLIERQAIRYVFDAVANEISHARISRLERNAIAVELAAEKISFRYDVARDFESDFARGDHWNHDALMLAVICENYIYHLKTCASALNADKPGNLSVPFPEKMIEKALVFSAKAEDLQSLTDDADVPRDPLIESVFLAHVNAFGKLKYIEHDLPEIKKELPKTGLERCADIIVDDLQPIYNFAVQGTRIGDELKHYAEYIENSVTDIIKSICPLEPSSPPVESPKKRPDLKLIVNRPSL